LGTSKVEGIRKDEKIHKTGNTGKMYVDCKIMKSLDIYENSKYYEYIKNKEQ
jgi:hypothetical protein